MLTDEQQDLIFGSLLGDGNLQTGSDGRTWRYRALHKKKHEPYLFHKYGILTSLCASAPAYGEVTDSRTGKVYQRWYFNTLTNPSLNFFANMFYTYDYREAVTLGKWVKDVPQKVEKFLTPRALAYFYMDDGALKWLYHTNAMRLCTESFSLEGVERIQKALKKLYNVETTLTRKTRSDGSTGYRISIPEKSSATFREVIQPYLVDCMKYKVSDGNRGHL
jgi:recombination protein RecA